MHDVYENIDDYNPYKENKILIVFDDMITLFSWCKFRNDWLRSHFNRLR